MQFMYCPSNVWQHVFQHSILASPVYEKYIWVKILKAQLWPWWINFENVLSYIRPRHPPTFLIQPVSTYFFFIFILSFYFFLSFPLLSVCSCRPCPMMLLSLSDRGGEELLLDCLALSSPPGHLPQLTLTLKGFVYQSREPGWLTQSKAPLSDKIPTF